MTVPELDEYVTLFRSGHYFEAHEVLERLWLQRDGDPFLQGLIIFAAAYVKVQRGSPVGATRHFRSALRYLRPYLPAREGFDVAAIVAQAERALALLVSGEPVPPFDLTWDPAAAAAGGARDRRRGPARAARGGLRPRRRAGAGAHSGQGGAASPAGPGGAAAGHALGPHAEREGSKTGHRMKGTQITRNSPGRRRGQESLRGIRAPIRWGQVARFVYVARSVQPSWSSALSEGLT